MKIERVHKQVMKVEEVEQKVVIYTKEEIETILKESLRKDGYYPGVVKFKIKWKYGQGNDVVVTELEEVQIEVS